MNDFLMSKIIDTMLKETPFEIEIISDVFEGINRIEKIEFSNKENNYIITDVVNSKYITKKKYKIISPDNLFILHMKDEYLRDLKGNVTCPIKDLYSYIDNDVNLLKKEGNHGRY